MSNQAFLDELAEALDYGGAITADSPLGEDIWNSMAIVSVIGLIDEHFDVTVPGEALQKCATVGALIALIEQQRKLDGEPS
ncbi:MAG: acyl carrier protein [Candidatus Hydrogenedentes bacterium]|nr:acyl carrier protein [Candidatus Hydrogenedentota bacterium]